MNPENPPAGATLTRDTNIRGLQAVSDALGNQGVTSEVCLFEEGKL